jgi:ubiquinone/menaquinone biosynthesis C-methylase UbiE
MSQEKPYILGTDQVELDRLKLQHDLWKDHLIRLWKKSNIQPGQKILELGCGPGYTTEELSEFTNQKSDITAVDISENFIRYLNSKKIPKIKTELSFIESLNLPEKNFDVAFCRWLMIFVPDIEIAIRKIAEHLKPKATFALQEYISYDSFSLAPDQPIMKKIIDAIFKSWMDQGGFPNQGRRLPMALEKNGFEVIEIEPIARVCRPQDPLWQWPETFFQSFLPRLVISKHISQSDHDEFFSVWEDSKKTAGAFCVTPTVVNIIARNR